MTSIRVGTRVRRREDLLANDLSDTETVLLDLAGGTYFGLQGASKAIWDELATPTTTDALCQTLLTKFEVDPETCRRETVAFLEDLRDRGLIVVVDETD